MAAEETEYYPTHQGNGLSGGARPGKKKPPPQRKKGSGTSFTPFFQGVTLGTVLLIPVGVWCWVRVDSVPAQVDTQETVTKSQAAKGKQALKRKPMRMVTPPRPKVTVVEAPKVVGAGESGPPPVIASPVPPAVPVTSQIPRVPEDDEQGADSAKPKKGLWKTITAPFRGKASKAGQPE